MTSKNHVMPTRHNAANDSMHNVLSMNANPSPRRKRRHGADGTRLPALVNDGRELAVTTASGVANPNALPSYNPITGHPCNPYIRKPPSFSKLAAKHDELKPFLVPINAGQQHTLDFSRPEATVALTKAILKCDWDLDVDIPSDTLCPTVTNRLNYLLELRDLLHFCGHTGPAHVLDIGTGFTTIYPLIGCRLEPSWRFTGTDIDLVALETARANVNRNNLSSRISLEHVGDPESPFFPPPTHATAPLVTATICNPPFYESESERTAHRLTKATSHIACPGTPEQMATAGGEVTFVSRMVRESVAVYQHAPDVDRPVVFSSMLGIKRSVNDVVAVIESLEVPWYTVRTLRQGVTSRWVVVWSFKALAVDRLTRFLTLDRTVSVQALATALDAVGVSVKRVSESAVDVELALATWTRRWKRRKLFGASSSGPGDGQGSVTPPSTESVTLAQIPAGDGVTGRRAEPIQVRMWWTNKDSAWPASSEPTTTLPASDEQYPPILLRSSGRKETAVWIAGPKSDPLMHSFVMFLTPLLDKN